MGRETSRDETSSFHPCNYFKLTIFVSGLKVSDSVFRAVAPVTVGNDDDPLVELPLGAMPAGKYCLLVMFTWVGPLTNPVT